MMGGGGGVKLKEMEVSNLSDKEFKKMVICFLNKLYIWMEKFRENFNKEKVYERSNQSTKQTWRIQ